MKDRKSYLNNMAAKLKEWDADIQKLEGKASKAKADKKAEYRQQIKEIRGKKQNAKQKLTEIRGAGEDAWEELRAGFEKSSKILGDSVKTAIRKMKS